MPDPLAAVTTVATPQSQPIPGREADQVRNAAGGYVFGKDLWTRLEDFLILGTTGGTYYVNEDELTAENAGVLFEALAADGRRVVTMATVISTARPPRAPRNRPALFALAAAFAKGDPDTRQAAKLALPLVARTTDHLSTFFGYLKNLGGKPSRSGTAPVAGRALRTALASWFLTPTIDAAAWKACKARQRKTPTGENFALRDVLRIAHPSPDCPGRAALLGWIAGTVSDEEARARVAAIDSYLLARAVTTPAQAIDVIQDRGVPWEFLPDEMLTKPAVWDALIDTIGLTALLRNLARMTRIGTLTPLSDAVARVEARLTDAEALRRARIHPMDVFLAMRVYAAGETHRRGPGGKWSAQTWTPIPGLIDALEESYEKAFGHVEPTGRRLLIAVDSSGSMAYGNVIIGGTSLGSVYEVAGALAVILARIEPAAHAIELDTRVRASRLSARTNLREIASWCPSGGGTDLSLPFMWARGANLVVDGMVVLTDMETWAGAQHPSQALTDYRQRVNPATRVLAVGLTAAGGTIADPRDDGVLNVAGLDASLPTLVSGFIRGAGSA